MPTEKEKMISGEYYDATDKELMEDRIRARRFARKFNATLETELKKRTSILKEWFGTTGEELYIEPDFRCDYGYNIHVGENFYANFNCVMLDVCEIHIGKNCFIAP